MKPIIQTNKQFSFKLRVSVFVTAIVAITAFFFSLEFSGNSKKEYSELFFSEEIQKPECSASAGFYNFPFVVKLISPDPDVQIYYTTDGSEPFLGSEIYHQPLLIENRSESRNYLSAIPTSPRWKPPVDNVFKGTVLRAIAVNQKNEKSKELVMTFFVFDNFDKKYTFPVISVTVNQKDLFGYNKGIYVLGKSYTDKDNYIRKSIPLDLPWWEYPSNYLMRGRDTEREAHIEFFEPDGKPGFECNVGLRINGNATRGFAQKSLRVCFREEYGQAQMAYNLFNNNKNTIFSSFILRNSGNDWTKTMFRDVFMQSLMKNTHVDIQDYRPSIVFINGEYWGIHNIQERLDENYLANKYQLNPDSITILELDGKLVKGNKEDEELFAELIDFVKKNDLSNDTNYEFVRSRADLRSFMDFVIANVYFCNSDWPNNNVKFWRYASRSDSLHAGNGRWRWMLYDTDWGFGYNSMSSPGTDLLDKAAKTESTGILFSGLIKNKEFADEFLARFQYHLNTTFNSADVIRKIDKFQEIYSPEMQAHIDRWRAIGSFSEWQSNVEILRTFARLRPQFQADQLNAFFDIKGDKQITLKSSAKAY